ncbi:MAG: hypothetical protein ACK48V_03390 [Crocinitomicaceae bacterium]|jgi:hypothetical protein
MKKHNFLLRRRNKIIFNEVPLLFGISGVARCGKDTLKTHLLNKFQKMGLPSISISFATALKQDLDPFLKEKLNISAFTENSSEKQIIRPMLVCWGTDTCRKINPDFWIEKIEKRIQSSIENKIIVVIPDVRYENEAKWIQKNGGFVIHLTRMGIKPANFEEKVNDPIVKKIANAHIRWKTFSEEKKTCNYHISKLFFNQGWTTYGKFK